MMTSTAASPRAQPQRQASVLVGVAALVPTNDTPTKAKLRGILNDLRTEFFVTGLVLLYMMLVFIDFILYEGHGCTDYAEPYKVLTSNIPSPPPPSPAPSPPSFETRWGDAFKWVDLSFLIVFMFELLLRWYAFGYHYFIDKINGADAIVIIVGFVLQIIVLADESIETKGLGFLRIVRLIRLVRIFVVMNKVQKARTAYKMSKLLKLGSPVDRVMELLQNMRMRCDDEEDEADVQWILQLIASDKLYEIDLSSTGVGSLDTEMTAYLVGQVGVKKEKQDVEEQKQIGQQDALKRQETAVLPDVAAQELRIVQDLAELPEVNAHLERIHTWDFDIFDFEAKAQGSALVLATYHLLDGYGLVDKFKLSKHRLLAFSRRIMEGYRANPYHNSLHALDVLLNTNYFIRQPVVAGLITPLDQLAVLLSAVLHDFQHPGLTNAYLQATKHEYAITYNDNSVLESHHVAAAWRVLLQDDCNFLKALSREQYLELREMVIQFVLGTDMKFHFEHLTKFKTKVSADVFKKDTEREDVKYLLAVLMHTGDIANPAKPMGLCLKWTEVVMEEFFQQGDLERKMKMPVSPFFDRDQTSVAQCQMGFINILVLPLYTEVTNLLGEPARTECFGALKANLSAWEQHGNALLKTGGTPME